MVEDLARVRDAPESGTARLKRRRETSALVAWRDKGGWEGVQVQSRVSSAQLQHSKGTRRMFRNSMNIESFDPDLARAIANERSRQEDHVELIASENYASPRVLEAQGSVLTNKYAEGYPGKRYYGGCEYVDVVEQLAIDRAKKLFGADYANVQPHSGSQANAAGYFALVKPGDTILGMSLDHGGHLTHGAKVNFSGKFFNAAQYGIRPTAARSTTTQVERLADEHRPKLDHRRFLSLLARRRLGALRGHRQERWRLLRGRHGARRGPRRGRHLSRTRCRTRTS